MSTSIVNNDENQNSDKNIQEPKNPDTPATSIKTSDTLAGDINLKSFDKLIKKRKNVNNSNKQCKKKKLNTLAKPLVECDYCKKLFTAKNSLIDHFRLHTKEKPFICLICGNTFTQRSSLVVHSRIHTGEKPYECDICKKKYIQKSFLRQHIRIHTGEKPFKCNVCFSSFRINGTLTKHMRKHTGEKPYECKYCFKCFSQRSSLKGHIRTHTGEKPFKCDVCLKSFSDRSHFKVHQLSHTTNNRRYQCNECKNWYREKYTLKIHLRTHLVKKPYPCNLCTKAFTTSSQLKRHLISHTGEKITRIRKKFNCTKCDKVYSKKYNLKNHMKKHHNNFLTFKCHNCLLTVFSVDDLNEHLISHRKLCFIECVKCCQIFKTLETIKEHVNKLHTVINKNLFNGNDKITYNDNKNKSIVHVANNNVLENINLNSNKDLSSSIVSNVSQKNEPPNCIMISNKSKENPNETISSESLPLNSIILRNTDNLLDSLTNIQNVKNKNVILKTSTEKTTKTFFVKKSLIENWLAVSSKLSENTISQIILKYDITDKSNENLQSQNCTKENDKSEINTKSKNSVFNNDKNEPNCSKFVENVQDNAILTSNEVSSEMQQEIGKEPQSEESVIRLPVENHSEELIDGLVSSNDLQKNSNDLIIKNSTMSIATLKNPINFSGNNILDTGEDQSSGISELCNVKENQPACSTVSSNSKLLISETEPTEIKKLDKLSDALNENENLKIPSSSNKNVKDSNLINIDNPIESSNVFSAKELSKVRDPFCTIKSHESEKTLGPKDLQKDSSKNLKINDTIQMALNYNASLKNKNSLENNHSDIQKSTSELVPEIVSSDILSDKSKKIKISNFDSVKNYGPNMRILDHSYNKKIKSDKVLNKIITKGFSQKFEKAPCQTLTNNFPDRIQVSENVSKGFESKKSVKFRSLSQFENRDLPVPEINFQKTPILKKSNINQIKPLAILRGSSGTKTENVKQNLCFDSIFNSPKPLENKLISTTVSKNIDRAEIIDSDEISNKESTLIKNIKNTMIIKNPMKIPAIIKRNPEIKTVNFKQNLCLNSSTDSPMSLVNKLVSTTVSKNIFRAESIGSDKISNKESTLKKNIENTLILSPVKTKNKIESQEIYNQKLVYAPANNSSKNFGIKDLKTKYSKFLPKNDKILHTNLRKNMKNIHTKTKNFIKEPNKIPVYDSGKIITKKIRVAKDLLKNLKPMTIKKAANNVYYIKPPVTSAVTKLSENKNISNDNLKIKSCQEVTPVSDFVKSTNSSIDCHKIISSNISTDKVNENLKINANKPCITEKQDIRIVPITIPNTSTCLDVLKTIPSSLKKNNGDFSEISRNKVTNTELQIDNEKLFTASKSLSPQKNPTISTSYLIHETLSNSLELSSRMIDDENISSKIDDIDDSNLEKNKNLDKTVLKDRQNEIMNVKNNLPTKKLLQNLNKIITDNPIDSILKIANNTSKVTKSIQETGKISNLDNISSDSCSVTSSKLHDNVLMSSKTFDKDDVYKKSILVKDSIRKPSSSENLASLKSIISTHNTDAQDTNVSSASTDLNAIYTDYDGYDFNLDNELDDSSENIIEYIEYIDYIEEPINDTNPNAIDNESEESIITDQIPENNRNTIEKDSGQENQKTDENKKSDSEDGAEITKKNSEQHTCSADNENIVSNNGNIVSNNENIVSNNENIVSDNENILKEKDVISDNLSTDKTLNLLANNEIDVGEDVTILHDKIVNIVKQENIEPSENQENLTSLKIIRASDIIIEKPIEKVIPLDSSKTVNVITKTIESPITEKVLTDQDVDILADALANKLKQKSNKSSKKSSDTNVKLSSAKQVSKIPKKLRFLNLLKDIEIKDEPITYTGPPITLNEILEMTAHLEEDASSKNKDSEVQIKSEPEDLQDSSTAVNIIQVNEIKLEIPSEPISDNTVIDTGFSTLNNTETSVNTETFNNIEGIAVKAEIKTEVDNSIVVYASSLYSSEFN